jgi:hypothetical protein
VPRRKVESITIPAPAISTTANGGTTVSVTIALPERKDLKYKVNKFDIKVDAVPGIFKPEVVADMTENLERNIEQEKIHNIDTYYYSCGYAYFCCAKGQRCHDD